MNWCVSLASFLLLFKKFFSNLFLNGGVGFCHTTMWIQHNYTYIPSLLRLPYLTTSYPSRPSQSTRLGSLYYAATSHKLAILHMTVYICQCSFSIHLTLSFLLRVLQVHSLHLCLHSFPANRFANSTFLDSIYMC